jgi:hypothetical protein
MIVADEEEFPLAAAFNEAILKRYPDNRVSIDEVLHAAASIAAAYLAAVPDQEEKDEEVECFVASVRESVYPEGQPNLCLGCAFADAFNRKFVAGPTKKSVKEGLDVLSALSAHFLAGATERGMEAFFNLVRSRRAAEESEAPASDLRH